MTIPEATKPDEEIVEYDGFKVQYKDASHRYWLLLDDDVCGKGSMEVRTPAISVTSVLGILDKPNLRRWYGTQDATATLQLEREGLLREVPTEQAVFIMRERGLGAEAKRDAGASRGTAVHDVLAAYCETGKIPRLGEFSDEVRPYVQALSGWLLEASPDPVMVEQIVGSPTYGFAGRFDLICNIRGVRTLVDAKTGSGAGRYPEAHTQLAGYEVCFPECQIPEVEDRIVLELKDDGEFNAVPGVGRQEAFLSVLAAHKAVAATKAAIKAADKAQQALAL